MCVAGISAPCRRAIDLFWEQIYNKRQTDEQEGALTQVHSISISLSAADLQKRLRLTDSAMAGDLAAKAGPSISAKAVYKVGYVDEKAEQSVVINGERFTSRVLRRNLAEVGRVFAFVLTLGDRYDARIDRTGDLLEKYYLDEIGNLALGRARTRLEKHLRRTYGLEKISCMAPGSLADWPIEEQAGLFRLIGEVEAAIGVKLTESMLMQPRKSVSGIYFPSNVTFFSCQLCPRERCDGRKAPYDEAMARQYGLAQQ
jgi:hypothetical protein